MTKYLRETNEKGFILGSGFQMVQCMPSWLLYRTSQQTGVCSRRELLTLLRTESRLRQEVVSDYKPFVTYLHYLLTLARSHIQKFSFLPKYHHQLETIRLHHEPLGKRFIFQLHQPESLMRFSQNIPGHHTLIDHYWYCQPCQNTFASHWFLFEIIPNQECS